MMMMMAYLLLNVRKVFQIGFENDMMMNCKASLAVESAAVHFIAVALDRYHPRCLQTVTVSRRGEQRFSAR